MSIKDKEDCFYSDVGLFNSLNNMGVIDAIDIAEYEVPTTNTTITAKTNLLTRDKISNTLLDKDIINKGEQLLKMEKKGSKDTVTTRIVVTLDPDEITKVSQNVSINYRFSYFDKCVFDSICSLLAVGNNAISLAMIARNMMGKKSTYHPSENMLNEIDETINKLEKIKVRIDLSEEVSHFSQIKNKFKSGKAILQSRFLEFRKLDTVLNGTETSVITFTAVPILLQYAKLRNQISSIKSELLDTPTQKNKTLLTVQTFLIQKINMLKLNPLLPQCIMYESIYELFNDEYANKNTKFLYIKIRESIISILDYWIEKGFIENYNIESKGRVRFYKINIFFSNNKIIPENIIECDTSNL